MSQQAPNRHGLLVPANFIRAVRESGYLNISTALAELVDNSLQAGAGVVAITILRSALDGLPEITVEDDGFGMSRSELQTCLRFGGSTRFNTRDSFGRFGMGLPAASLSQAREVEVVSWRQHGAEYSVRLDVDAIAAGAIPTLLPRRRGASQTMSGCRVIWRRCDRIEYQRLAWLERAVRRDLGRMYRRYIESGVKMTVNGALIESVDPMMVGVKVEGATARLACEPLRYELETSAGETSTVTVRFAVLPVRNWHGLDNLTKRRVGIVGHDSVSILRAGREIAAGWHLMGGKRRENYDDWWRCEIEFDPTLDEHFGITINKQGIRPSPALREALEPELEAIARSLNARVREAFEDVKFQAATEASCRIAAAADADLPVIRSRGRGGALQYRIGSEALPMDTMIRSTLRQRTLGVILNVDHPAFTALYQPLLALDAEAARALRTSLELLLLSLARSAIQVELAGGSAGDLITAWSATYGRMLQKT